QVAQAPYTRVGGVNGNLGHGLAEVIGAGVVDVVGIEFAVVAQHDDLMPAALYQTDARGQAHRLAAGPTVANAVAVAACAQRLGVVEVFGLAVGAVAQDIAQLDHGGAPFAFAHAAMYWVGDALGKGAR